MASFLQTPGLYLRTLRHLTGTQIAWRCRYALRKRMGTRPRLPDPPPGIAAAPDTVLALRNFARLCQGIAAPPHGKIESWRAGDFTFLNETLHAAGGPPWAESESRPRLWRYHLHYFDYARDLAIENAGLCWDEDKVLLRAWMHDWIAKHPVGADVAWDAFPTAARILNWSIAEAVFQFDDERILESLYTQTEWLLRHIEYDIGANHLMKNAAALTVAGALLGGRAATAGPALLAREVRAQILPDGGHEERSPMYHAHVLADILVAHAVLPGKNSWLRSAILRMAGWLDAVCHPDGEIPLFCDAALGDAPAPRALLGLASQMMSRPPQRTADRGGAAYALHDSGYYVLAPEDRRGWMILKACSAAPAHQPGHAHCDVLSYEFSAGSARLIVDSGVHGYADSPHRAYCRGTAAHNTVQIGDREQHECWSVFRVGRRAAVTVNEWTGTVLDAEHDGFAPARHRRRVHFERPGRWHIEDRVEGNKGAGWRSLVHVHPEAAIVASDDGAGFRISRDGRAIHIQPAPGTACVLESPDGAASPAWYCPEFGVAIPAPVLVFRPAPGAKDLAYAIVAGEDHA